MPKVAAKPAKIDLLRQHKDEYAQPKSPKIIDIGEASYLVVRGSGSPDSQGFEDAVGALYGMAYTLKFQSKFAGRDYTVCKLEGLFGVDGQSAADIPKLDKSEWNWHMVIRVPGFITQANLDAARQTLREKGKQGDFDAVDLEAIDEGTCVQMLHVGPYSEETPTIRQMHAYAAEQGYAPSRWHHEIYLSDPRRVAPEKLRTILRHPVSKI